MDPSKTNLELNRQRFLKLYWFLGGLLTILACFVTYFLVREFHVSSSLAEASRLSFAQESRTDLSLLNEYFEQIISDMETLLNSRALRSYYQNKALGMSFEYGLAVAAAELTEEFERFQKSVLTKNRPIFDQIMFLDSKEKRVVAETQPSTNSKGIEATQPKIVLESPEKSSPFDVIETGGEWTIFTFKPFTYKDKVRGYLLMTLDMRTILYQTQFHDIPKSGEFNGITDSRGILIFGPREFIGKRIFELLGFSPSLLVDSRVIETDDHKLDQVKEPLLVSGGKILDTPFYLVNIAPKSKYLAGYSTSLWGMVFAGMMGGLAIMVVVIFKSLQEQSRIYRQLEEARDTLDNRVRARTTELAETNLRLQKEMDQRERTEEIQRLLTTAIEQAAEGIVITDITGNIEYVNPAFEGITGYANDEIIGQNPRILQSGYHDQAFYRELWETIRNGEVWRGQFVNRKKDGTLYREDAIISPVKDRTGKIVHYVAVKRDRNSGDRTSTTTFLVPKDGRDRHSSGRYRPRFQQSSSSNVGACRDYAPAKERRRS